MKEYGQTIEPVTGTVIVNPRGEILLVTGPKWKGRYTIPGGHIEYGERMIDAVQRELKEEIGMVPERIEFLNAGDAVFPEYFHRKAHFIFLNFIGWVQDASPITLCEREFSDHLWVSPHEALGSVPIVESVRAVIEEYVEKYARQ